MSEKEQKINDLLKVIAADIKEKLPDGMGFALLSYEFGEGEDKRMYYISDSNRTDVMNAMVEFLEKNVKDPEMFGKDV